jgi:hypothetical protein
LDSGNIEIWRGRFHEVGEFLNNLYRNLADVCKESAVRDLLVFAARAESTQAYLWTYIDYGIRVPIYRTLQWLSVSLPEDIRPRLEGEFLDRLSVHVLKEFTLMWSIILDSLHGYAKDNKELAEFFRKVLHLNSQEGFKYEIEDLKGASSELKAIYVLVDHEKPLIPFSIMQSPIIPSYIRPGVTSGDVYLFEENLVVDVKSSNRVDRETGLPTYYHRKTRTSLAGDLRNIGRSSRLYGIRKGIGVVSDDGVVIRLAVYVPWRGPKKPLLYLESPRLPLFIYVNNIGKRGVDPHRLEIRGDTAEVVVSGYAPSGDVGSGGVVLEEISVDNVELVFPRKPGLKPQVSVERNKRDIKIRFTLKLSELEEAMKELGILVVNAVGAMLTVYHTYRDKERNKREGRAKYPVIAATPQQPP